LYNVLVKNNLLGDFTIDESYPEQIEYVSNIGTDQVSGCILTFKCYLNRGCQGVETYANDYLNVITPPNITVDSHAFHTDL